MMTRNDISTLHPIHEWHERYIRLTDNLPVLTALQKYRKLFSAGEVFLLQQLGDRVYLPGKWTVRDTLQHLLDTERILSYRALRIARNDHLPLAGFDEASFAQFTRANERSIENLLEEFDLLRRTSVALYKNFDEPMLRRKGLCSDIPISVLALGYVIAGHPLHHAALLRKQYFPLLGSDQLSLVVNEPLYFPFFESLNRAWIEKSYVLEPDDLFVLGNPQAAIIDKGGAILFAVRQGQVVGTVALQPTSSIECEMVKMAVGESHREKGIGRLLVRAAIAHAREMNLRRLVLHSNSEYNAAAVHLYRMLGFNQVPLGESRYQRANIKMEINLYI